jgi:hypothetical protein
MVDDSLGHDAAKTAAKVRTGRRDRTALATFYGPATFNQNQAFVPAIGSSGPPATSHPHRASYCSLSGSPSAEELLLNVLNKN